MHGVKYIERQLESTRLWTPLSLVMQLLLSLLSGCSLGLWFTAGTFPTCHIFAAAFSLTYRACDLGRTKQQVYLNNASPSPAACPSITVLCKLQFSQFRAQGHYTRLDSFLLSPQKSNLLHHAHKSIDQTFSIF